VGQHLGLRLDQLLPNFNTCAASETASRAATDVAFGFGVGVIAEGIGWLLEDAVEGFNPCALCFAAGTPVHTDHGEVPIERIKFVRLPPGRQH
jgi:hypothetical protein